MNSAVNFNHCPCCGRAIRRPRPAAEPATPVDTSRLPDMDVFHHYRRTAPVEDLRFFLRHVRLSPDLRAAGESLLVDGCRDTGGMLSRTEWYRRLTTLQDRWRLETTDAALPEVSALAEAV